MYSLFPASKAVANLTTDLDPQLGGTDQQTHAQTGGPAPLRLTQGELVIPLYSNSDIGIPLNLRHK